MTNKIFSALKVIALAVVLSFGLSYVYAWTAPSATPPTGNVSAPINTSGIAQTKEGGFNIATGSGKVGIGVIASDPNSKLEVKGGNFSVAPEAGAGRYVLDWPNGNGSARIRMWDQVGTQGVYVASDHNSFFNGGNVGIGTTNPLSKLSVGGAGNVAASIYGIGSSYGAMLVGTTFGVIGSGASVGVAGQGPTGVQGSGSNYGIVGSGGLNDFFGINGEKTVGGVWTNAPSYRRYKENFSNTDGYLDKLTNLDIYEWQYKDEVIDGVNRYKSDQYRHASPFLDDFYKTFKLGTEDGYNIQDLSGVAISSVKELNRRVTSKNDELSEKIVDQQRQIDALIARIEKLEVGK